ncbi:MAG: hypothetical protein LBT48_01915 [Prevotellaceae bacterium]|jgi:hypothetical protein|nr:hypothetical protein [Prevotellaceae bacterium]
MIRNYTIGELIDKYFEGLTSLEEEQELRDYFQQENVPEAYGVYKSIFQYFTSERRQEKQKITVTAPKKMRILLRWTSLAAACLLLFFCLWSFLHTENTLPNTSVAYIDGKKCTDMELIQQEASRSLANVSDGNKEACSAQIGILDIIMNN